nr:uncharacterized protein LOC119188018 [Rhipicephalus microplus]
MRQNPLSLVLEEIPLPYTTTMITCDTSQKSPRPFIPVQFRHAVFDSLTTSATRESARRRAGTVTQAFVATWVSRYGCPLRITTDRRRQFQSNLFSVLARLLGTRLQYTTAYHPASNGMVKRLHRQLKASLTAKLDREHWVEKLPLVLLGLRTAIKEDLGFCAAEMLYGSTIRLPGEFFGEKPSPTPTPSEHKERLQSWLEHLPPCAPSVSRNQRVFSFPDMNEATQVFVRRDTVKAPLTPAYDGPFRVLSRSHKTVTICVREKEDVVSLDRVKPAHLID